MRGLTGANIVMKLFLPEILDNLQKRTRRGVGVCDRYVV